MTWNISAGKNREGFIPQQLQRRTLYHEIGEYFPKNKINEKINEKCDYLRRRNLDEIVDKRALNL